VVLAFKVFNLAKKKKDVSQSECVVLHSDVRNVAYSTDLGAYCSVIPKLAQEVAVKDISSK